MNKSLKRFSIEECKVQASILLKSLHSTDSKEALATAKRFQLLAEFKHLALEEIIKADIKRKHALTVIAIKNGFKSWDDLKTQSRFIIGGFLNSWFAKYAEAKRHLKANDGYLLPYKNQFFICNTDYIKQIGFDPDDPDWQRIGYNWVDPDDKKAWQRLYKKWNQSKGGRHE